ncbi:MAG: AMP-binding protein, partial [Chromatiales bacterium]|nr:AMP-binding protein [Chromatiales bacterium]
LTAERFVADPYAEEPGARMYRTGDRARWRSDGELELLGRVDDQVKLRGFRIEPAEVESALLSHAGVREAVVICREDRPGDRRLVAYVSGDESAAGDLRGWLLSRLPEYMVPGQLVWLDRLPLTANGKLARRELPEPVQLPAVDPVGPRTAEERVLCELFAEVLGVARVGVTDDFFALGGHSLLATQLVARVRSVLGRELALRAVFAEPTVTGLARAVAAAPPAGQASLGIVAVNPAQAAASQAEGAPLSIMQQRLWFLDRLRPGDPAWNLAWALRLSGELDEGALAQALIDVIGRHAVLRTRIIERDGEPWQQVEAVPGRVLEVHAPVREGELAVRLRGLVERPFDLSQGGLLRATRVPLADAPGEQVLLLVVHHIVADGWSLSVLLRELSQAYTARVSGQAPSWPVLELQYTDYARWQRSWLSGERLSSQAAFWRERLAGAPVELALPADRPRPLRPTGRGARLSGQLDAALVERLEALARETGCTLYMVLLSGFALLLGRLSGSADVLVGTPVAGRSRRELEALVGFFVNTLVLRVDLSGDPTVEALLARVRSMALDAYAHQDLPFEQLVELLRIPRDTRRNPLVQVLFNLHNEPAGRLALPGVEASLFGVGRSTSKFDLGLSLTRTDEGLALGLEYSTELFTAARMQAFIAAFAAVLTGLVANRSGRLSSLLWEDVDGPVLPSSGLLLPPSGATVSEVFASRVSSQGTALAVVCGEERLDYTGLDGLSDRMAGALRVAGAGPGTRVGLWFGPGVSQVAAMLAVLKAGACFVPLDRQSPAVRLSAQASSAGLRLVLGDGTPVPGLEAVPQLGPADWSSAQAKPVRVTVAAEAPAYLLYTSGTTGEPKAVLQTQGNLVMQVMRWARGLGLGPGDRLSLLSGYGHDAAIQDVFGALLSGACVHPLDVRGQPRGELLSVIAGLTVLHATPTVFRYLLGSPPEVDLGGLRLVVLGGEAAYREDLELFRAYCRRGAVF